MHIILQVCTNNHVGKDAQHLAIKQVMLNVLCLAINSYLNIIERVVLKY